MSYRPDPEGIEVEELHVAADFRGAKLLEIGSGDGRLLFRYADFPSLAVGIDPNLASLRKARASAAETHGKIALLQSRAEELPFPDRSFDIALLAWTL